MVSLLEGSDTGASEPVEVLYGEYRAWAFKGKVYYANVHRSAEGEEIKLRLKHYVLARQMDLDQIRREVEAFQNLSSVDRAARERIPDSVRLFVWQRDQGRCNECRGNYRLEFDHIIPVVLGGSSTERNIQLLCEPCNRKKGGRISTIDAR